MSLEGATFRALAYRMTYAEAKDLMILDGDGRNDAESIGKRKRRRTGQLAAQKTLYWKKEDRANVEQPRYFDFNQAAPARLSATPGAKPPAGAKGHREAERLVHDAAYVF